MSAEHEFASGVIEGFYGQPWTQAQRRPLFSSMANWGFNTYLYAPKDDLKHRTLWREPYNQSELSSLEELIRSCQQHQLRFVFALSPGLDIRFSCSSEMDLLKARFRQLINLGCRHFAILFDDIPERMHPEDAARFTSFAVAQAQVTNELFRWTRQEGISGKFYFCPTPYCGRMAMRNYGGAGYLEVVGRELFQEIDIFWTGPEIISATIPLDHIRQVRAILRRKPVLWDNLHANDYDSRRFYTGPYSGRAPELLQELNGILTNPNTEFPLNFPALQTLSDFLRSPETYQPRQAFLKAMQVWLTSFGTVTKPVSTEELILFADCYYLPHEDGPEAENLFLLLHRVISSKSLEPANVKALQDQLARLRNFCIRMPELRDRQLFYALSRRVWDLREEVDLLERYLEHLSQASPALPFASDYHLPFTYRGGFVSRLQQLLTQQPDGSFQPKPITR